MSTWNLIYLFAFLGGAILSLLLTPVFQWIARRTGFLDELHKKIKKSL